MSKYKLIHIQEDCIGCKACENSCPNQCIVIKEVEE